MKVAIFFPGQPGPAHHKELYEPAPALHVGYAITREFPEAEVRVFAMERFGFELDLVLNAISEFSPDVLLASVPVSGYYPQVLRVIEWARQQTIPCALGGYHFNIQHTAIPRIAARRLDVPIAYGQAILTAPALVRALLNQHPISETPGICYFNGSRVRQNPLKTFPVSAIPHPTLPSWDYEYSWRLFPHYYTRIQERFSGRRVATAILMGALGCTYRSARLKLPAEKVSNTSYPALKLPYYQPPETVPSTGCDYCTLTHEVDHCDPVSFRQKLLAIATLVKSKGYEAVFIKETGDDTGSRRKVIQSWIPVVKMVERETGVKFLFNIYAWLVPTLEQAQELKKAGVVQLYIGAEGKVFSTPEVSNTNPLIRTLQNLQKVGIMVDLGYVLGGKLGQTWEEINQWLAFAEHIWKEFGDIVRLNNGWPYIAAPGDPNWHKYLTRLFPQYNETDNPDLPQAQIDWLTYFTNLGEGQEVLRRFEQEIQPQFSKFSRVEKTFFVEPFKWMEYA